MKKGILSRSIKGEKGQALILVLIAIALCGLILTPLLAYMASGVKIVRAVHEEKMREFYAADAGIEDAMWQLNNDILTVPLGNPNYLEVNGITVTVTIENAGDLGYKITSVAEGTTIEAYVDIADFSGILDNAITSRGSIPPKPNTIINGQYSLPDSDDAFRIYGGMEGEVVGPKGSPSISVDPGKFNLPDYTDTFEIYNYSEADSGTITVNNGSINVTTMGGATISDNTITAGESANWTIPVGGSILGEAWPVGTINTNGSWTYLSIETECDIYQDFDEPDDATIWGGSIVVTATSPATINGTDEWKGTAGQSVYWTTPVGGGTIDVVSGADGTKGSFAYTCTTTEFHVTNDTGGNGEAYVHGGSIDDYSDDDGDWPSDIYFSRYYRKQVDTSAPYLSGIIDANDTSFIGLPEQPDVKGVYREGDLVIRNSGPAGKTITLNNTLFVTGDLNIGYQTGGNTFDLNLNGNTIFVQSTSSGNGNEAIQIGSKCNINGSGCIIALGDIYFAPNATSTAPDYVLVMSILNGVNLQPNATFYGSIAGSTIVEIQPNGSFEWMDWNQLEAPLNFPGIVPEFVIKSWKITINPPLE